MNLVHKKKLHEILMDNDLSNKFIEICESELMIKNLDLHKYFYLKSKQKNESDLKAIKACAKTLFNFLEKIKRSENGYSYGGEDPRLSRNICSGSFEYCEKNITPEEVFEKLKIQNLTLLRDKSFSQSMAKDVFHQYVINITNRLNGDLQILFNACEISIKKNKKRGMQGKTALEFAFERDIAIQFYQIYGNYPSKPLLGKILKILYAANNDIAHKSEDKIEIDDTNDRADKVLKALNAPSIGRITQNFFSKKTDFKS